MLLNSRYASARICTPLLPRFDTQPLSQTAAHAEPLHILPVPMQELYIVEDVLYSLLGIEGTYIRARYADGSAASTSTGAAGAS